MNKNNNITRIIVIFSITIIALLLATILLDYLNIRNIFPFNHLTSQYDWFGIIGAIIGGLIGAVSTYIGIALIIKNEREVNKKKDIEERKRVGYSYLTLSDYPLTLKIALDSILTGNLDQNQNTLIAENVNAVGANYFDIELNFKNINNNYPTAVMVDDIEIAFDSEVENNIKMYKKILRLYGYKKVYSPLTVKNNEIIAFESRALINKKQLEEIKLHLLNSQFIDITANVNFINANGVVTSGKFSANLIKDNNVKLGSSKRLGSNKEKIKYKAENTYLILKNIDYCENYGAEIFGGK